MSEVKRDKYLNTKGFKLSKSGSKGFVGPVEGAETATTGAIRIQLSLDSIQAKELLTELTNQINTSEGQVLGVKFDIHAGLKTRKNGPGKFNGAYFFCKALQRNDKNEYNEIVKGLKRISASQTKALEELKGLNRATSKRNKSNTRNKKS